MPAVSLKPDSPAVRQYYLMLKEAEGQDALHEGNVRRAFETLLRETAKPVTGWELVTEVSQRREANAVRYDGVLKDSWTLEHGYWEAKDTRDDLDTEIRKKIARGYPLKNIIFEDTRTGVLFQDEREVCRVNLRQPDAPERSAEGELGDAQRRRGPVHRQDVAVVLFVAGEHRSLDLDLIEETIGKQRADRTVHETAGERLLHRRPSLTLEEATGELARCGGTLPVIASEREEIDAGARGASRCGDNHRRFGKAHEDGTGRLLRQLPCLDAEGVIPEFAFNNRFHENSSFFPSRPATCPVQAAVTRGNGAKAPTPNTEPRRRHVRGPATCRTSRTPPPPVPTVLTAPTRKRGAHPGGTLPAATNRREHRVDRNPRSGRRSPPMRIPN